MSTSATTVIRPPRDHRGHGRQEQGVTEMDSHDVVSEHRAAGRRFEAAGISSFAREAGPPGSEPVVCLHGVPASCFLYRKVLRELEARGLRGIAFDLPGSGSPIAPPPSTTPGPGSAGSAPPPWTPSDSTGSTWSSTTSAGRRLRALFRADQPHRPPSDR